MNPLPITHAAPTPRSSELWIIGAALVATAVKLAIAFNTFGTNDVTVFYLFARALDDRGAQWVYTNLAPFNHPPLVAVYLRAILHLSRVNFLAENGISFPFMLRLPGIIADFATVLVLLRARRTLSLSLPDWALLFFALSPVSVMVSGFHGNTDGVMVLFLVLATYAGARRRPILCGLLLGLSCQAKIAPLLLVPIFLAFWFHRRLLLRFALPFSGALLVVWFQPLVRYPAVFVKHVLSYGGYWGIWGFSYWLRQTGLAGFKKVSFLNLPAAETITVSLLKLVVIAAVLWLAWRRRRADGKGLIETIAWAWIAFFIFSPGICAQYMVWLMPFVLVLSPRFFAHLLWSSSLFLFFFYNTICHGLPWGEGISTNALNPIWTPWTNWPWAVLIAGALLLWKRTALMDREASS